MRAPLRRAARAVPWSAATAALLAGGGVLAARLAGPAAGSRMLPWVLGRGLGLAAYLALVALVGVGLWLRHPWHQRLAWPEPTAALRLHGTLAAATGVLVAGHVGALVLDRYAGVGWLGAVWPGRASYRPAAVALGTAAVYLGLLVGLTAALAGRLVGRWWRPVHLLATVTAVVVWLHAVLAGSDTVRLRPLYLVTGAGLAFLAASRRLATRPVPTAPTAPGVTWSPP